jgi:hypothetical protein
MLGRADPVGDELHQPPIVADHTQRPIPCTDEPARADHDSFQCGPQVEIGAHTDHGVEQRTQPFPTSHDVADPVEQLVQQLVEVNPRQRRQAELRHLTRLVGLVRDVSDHEADGIAAGFQR